MLALAHNFLPDRWHFKHFKFNPVSENGFVLSKKIEGLFSKIFAEGEVNRKYPLTSY